MSNTSVTDPDREPPMAFGNGPATATAPTLKLRAYDTEVALARRLINQMLAGLVPAVHLDDLATCASELVTNAIHAARLYADMNGFRWTYMDTPVHFGIDAGARWTRLDVRDPDPAMPTPVEHDLMDESGRGLIIVNALAACRWWSLVDGGKAVHAVIAMPQVELTADELAVASR